MKQKGSFKMKTIISNLHYIYVAHSMQVLYCLLGVLFNYSSQQLKWIKKVNQRCPKTRTHFGFRLSMMKGFDPLQMLTRHLCEQCYRNH